MLGGAAYEPDSAGKMPTGPTAKMGLSDFENTTP